MRLKKRGFLATVYAGMEILVGVAFAYFLLRYAYDRGAGLDFERVYLAHDIALTINALHGIPGNALVDYDNGYMQQYNRQYDILVKGSTVRVSVSTDADLSSAYIFGRVDPYPIDADIKSPHYLSFSEQNGKIEISTTKTAAAATGCPQTDTSADIKQQILLFEPGHYSGEKGNAADNLEEYKITKQIADNIDLLCKAKGYKCKFVQQQDINSKKSEIKDTAKNMFISIHVGSSSSGSPAVLSIPVSDDKSSKLACILANSLRQDFSPISIEKVDIKSIKKDDLNVLEPALPAPAISIEIGSINNADFFTKQNNIAGIASSIIKGIEDYYAAK